MSNASEHMQTNKSNEQVKLAVSIRSEANTLHRGIEPQIGQMSQ